MIVAPYVGAWIETYECEVEMMGDAQSRTLRGCVD